MKKQEKTGRVSQLGILFLTLNLQDKLFGLAMFQVIKYVAHGCHNGQHVILKDPFSSAEKNKDLGI